LFQPENGLREIGTGKDRNAAPLRDGKSFFLFKKPLEIAVSLAIIASLYLYIYGAAAAATYIYTYGAA
jgi:hypothetical protein